jgi:predicted acyl esterase
MGALSGELKAMVNKRDLDFTLALYEVMPDGRFFNLSYFLGRASYAHDWTHCELLTPGRIATLPFERTPYMGRKLIKGSRLLLLLSVNKNAYAEVNYGSGKDVALESVADAGAPMQVHWYSDSFIRVPLTELN